MLFDSDEITMQLLSRDSPMQIKIKILMKISYFPTGSTVAGQHEDDGPWMLGTIVRHGYNDHHGRC